MKTQNLLYTALGFAAGYVIFGNKNGSMGAHKKKYMLQSTVSGKVLVNAHGDKWKTSDGMDFEWHEDFINDIITFATKKEAEEYKEAGEMWAMEVVEFDPNIF